MDDAANFCIAYPSSIDGAIYEEVGMKPAASLPTGEFPKGWEQYSTEKIGEPLGDADAITVTAKPGGTVDPGHAVCSRQQTVQEPEGDEG